MLGGPRLASQRMGNPLAHLTLPDAKPLSEKSKARVGSPFPGSSFWRKPPQASASGRGTPLAILTKFMVTLVRSRVAATIALGLLLLVSGSEGALAQEQEPTPASPAKPAEQPQEPSTTAPTKPAENELNLINLPTTRSLGRHESYFRITHRFIRDLRRGDFGQLLEDLFALDNGASIGLEYRFGLTSNLQAGVNRTALNKTIEFFGRYDRWRQSDSFPVSVSILGSVEGLDNFQEDFQPGIGAVVSHLAANWLVLYASPTFVWNTRLDGSLPGAEEDGDSNTLFVGLGARVRFRPTAYIVGEYSPRLAGHDPGRAIWGAAIEKSTRGHTFQLNFTNSFGTLPGQIARGGSGHDVYLGFNMTRRF
jgi:hypothetical protein